MTTFRTLLGALASRLLLLRLRWLILHRNSLILYFYTKQIFNCSFRVIKSRFHGSDALFFREPHVYHFINCFVYFFSQKNLRFLTLCLLRLLYRLCSRRLCNRLCELGLLLWLWLLLLLRLGHHRGRLRYGVLLFKIYFLLRDHNDKEITVFHFIILNLLIVFCDLSLIDKFLSSDFCLFQGLIFFF